MTKKKKKTYLKKKKKKKTSPAGREPTIHGLKDHRHTHYATEFGAKYRRKYFLIAKVVNWGKFGCVRQCYSVLICSYEKAHQRSKLLVEQFSRFNIAHISKFVVHFNLIMMSKPKYIFILTSLFCSVVARGTSHFYSCFSVNGLARVAFWYDNLGLWPRPKITRLP